MKAIIIISAYIAIGYVVGIPLAALLDYVTHSKLKDSGNTAFAIFGWPITVVISLLLLPLTARDCLHAKLSRGDVKSK